MPPLRYGYIPHGVQESSGELVVHGGFLCEPPGVHGDVSDTRDVKVGIGVLVCTTTRVSVGGGTEVVARLEVHVVGKVSPPILGPVN